MASGESKTRKRHAADVRVPAPLNIVIRDLE
jgi:hypothetical protein